MARKKRAGRSKKSASKRKAAKAGNEPVASGALQRLLDEVSRRGLGDAVARPEGDPSLALDVPGGGPATDLPRQVERADRVPFEGYVRVERQDRVVRALAQDLSESGVFLAAMGSPLAKRGDDISLELPLPDGGESMWITGRVVRDEERAGFFAVAVSFNSILERDRLRLQRYVAGRAHLLD